MVVAAPSSDQLIDATPLPAASSAAARWAATVRLYHAPFTAPVAVVTGAVGSVLTVMVVVVRASTLPAVSCAQYCSLWVTEPAAGAAVSYTHLRAHETRHDLVCRLLLE